MKPFTKKVLLEMADKGKVLCFFFSPTTQLLETYGGKDFAQNRSVVCFAQSVGRKVEAPNMGLVKERATMETMSKTYLYQPRQ